MLRTVLSLAVVLGAVLAGPDAPSARAELRIATFQCDVTPPLNGHPLIWLTKVETVEDPLLAKGVILDDGKHRYVLCAVDWCGLCNSSHRQFREKIAAGACTTADRVDVHCVHQHTAPYTDGDAQRLLDKTEQTLPYVDFKFMDAVTDRLGAAVKTAVGRLEPFDQVGAGQAKVDRVASMRRILTPEGKIISRMSSATDPKLRAMPEGNIDPLLRTVTLARAGKPIARLHYYATHPQSFYGDPRASSDCVGFARERMEKKEGVFQVYFNGCGGDVTMGKYNDRSREARDQLTDRIFAGMSAAAAATRLQPADAIRWNSLLLKLPARTDKKYCAADQRAVMSDIKVNPLLRVRAATAVAYAERADQPIDLNVLTIGNVRILHLPGESLIEFQHFVHKTLPHDFVAVAAYGDTGTGYICYAKAYEEGGYEPTASHLPPQAEQIYKEAIRKVLTASKKP